MLCTHAWCHGGDQKDRTNKKNTVVRLLVMQAREGLHWARSGVYWRQS